MKKTGKGKVGKLPPTSGWPKEGTVQLGSGWERKRLPEYTPGIKPDSMLWKPPA
ncbi:MAG: hypothetical protein JXB88_13245 [Spirochaetales bacterium]|nr:hypothetical protein [Spirochaetales bacterium]